MKSRKNVEETPRIVEPLNIPDVSEEESERFGTGSFSARTSRELDRKTIEQIERIDDTCNRIRDKLSKLNGNINLNISEVNTPRDENYQRRLDRMVQTANDLLQSKKEKKIPPPIALPRHLINQTQSSQSSNNLRTDITKVKLRSTSSCPNSPAGSREGSLIQSLSFILDDRRKHLSTSDVSSTSETSSDSDWD